MMNQVPTNQHNTIKCQGGLIDLDTPKVMGIVNVTPDSFFNQSCCQDEKEMIAKVTKHIEDGASIIDIGAYSTRSGCIDISPDMECTRIKKAMTIIRREFGNVPVSVDTFRANVAEKAVAEFGADIINDISGGTIDPKMIEVAGRTQAPYILMHMKGTPQNMMELCDYDNMLDEIIKFFATQIEKLKAVGVNDIILDPGFGFSKNLDQNYELLSKLDMFNMFQMPILVGVSRKSMIHKLLNTTVEEALNGTTVINTIALNKGAKILRVHDVKQAVETIKICQKAGFCK